MNPANILNAYVGTFQVNSQYVGIAAYRLALQMKQVMVPPDPSRPPKGIGGSIATGYGDRLVTFTIENATVRDVLDKLCLSADLNIWVVAYPQTTAKTRGGFAKTIRLGEGAPPEDDDKFTPTFHFLYWGNPVNVF